MILQMLLEERVQRLHHAARNCNVFREKKIRIDLEISLWWQRLGRERI